MTAKKKYQTITIVLPSNPPMRSVDRIERFDSPLGKVLELKKIGSIIGSRTGVRSCDIDVMVSADLFEEAVLLLSKKLKKLECPEGTRIISGTWSKKVA